MYNATQGRALVCPAPDTPQLTSPFKAQTSSKVRQALRVNRNDGFTLIELIVAIAVLIILSAFSSSVFSHFMDRQKEKTAFDNLHHLISFARTKAIRDKSVFTLCASDDNRACDGQWHRQLIVFEDINRNGLREDNEALHRVMTLAEQTPCMEWRAGLGRNYLRFKPDGLNAGTAGHFRFCESGDSYYRQHKVVVSFTGRTSLQKL